ncbi:glycosyltransferase [Microlunatus soli]|uniref:Glycosyltransferase involved in cell wall bisynthesis n=1 Tax=Microlunatus soli TaxID=630515 RepID=A0A1H1YGZ8_9ACTN|nr:glycosyltransferase [Microlunatus soli]SDT20549.1 Glycosyltransferase involved in cell wall bisynthesis [Microlunatus soli]
MKIVIGADSYAPDINGAARFAGRLARGLAARGHEVHVVSASTEGPEQLEHDGAVTIHRMRSIRYRWHATMRVCLPWLAGPDARDLLEQLQPDVVHVQSHMVVGRAVANAADRLGIPLVATNHFVPENVFGYVPFLPRRFHGPAGRMAWRDLARVFGQADVITAPTPLAVSLLTEATGLSGEAVSNGIDVQRYQEAARQAELNADPQAGPVILFVGRLDQEKRVDELIAAFARIPAETGARLEIVGGGDQFDALVGFAAELGVDDRVSFLGQVSDEELLAAYGRASIFCMPGVAELQSLVTLEAMSAGKPVVAANAMALPHLVQSGHNGWLYTPGDIGELALRLSTLVADPRLRERMGQHSRTMVSHHDFEATLDTFTEIYASAGAAVRGQLRSVA